MINKILNLAILFVAINTSCSQDRTYLSDHEKNWNPYKPGQVLIFGTDDGRTDTIKITDVMDHQFPDGLGALKNERLRVEARIFDRSISKTPDEVLFLYIFSRTATDPCKIDFKFSIGDGAFWGKPYLIMELDQYPEASLETPYRTFNDVIRIEHNSNQVLDDNDVRTIFWSKSYGYVKCQKKDGTDWALLTIK